MRYDCIKLKVLLASEDGVLFSELSSFLRLVNCMMINMVCNKTDYYSGAGSFFLKSAIVVLLMMILVACSSPLGSHVNEAVSNSYFHHKDGNAIVYSSNGAWAKVGYHIMDADAASFEPINDMLGKDNAYIYYKQSKQAHVDYKTFVVDGNVVRDEVNVYVKSSGLKPRLKVIDGADPASFRYIQENNKVWAKDAKNYYRIHRVVDVDYSSFQLMTDGLSADRDYIYANYRDVSPVYKVTGAVERVNHFYITMGNSLISYSIKNELQRIDFEQLYSIDVIDNHRVVVNGSRLVSFGMPFKYQDVDVKTFRVMDDRRHTIDRFHVYYNESVIEGADVETFEVLSIGYGKDKARVYYKGSVLEGVAPGNFRIEKSIATDGVVRFSNGAIIHDR